MDQYARGKAALERKDYDTAIKDFTEAIRHNIRAVDYYIQRSVAYQRASRHQESLADAETAVVLAYNRQRRELIRESQYRRFMALFFSGKYADAKFVLDLLKKMDGDKPDKRLPLVESQLAAKLAKLEPGDIASTSTVKEIPDVPLPELQQESATKAESKATSSVSTATTAANMPTPANKIKHDYYDTPEKVTITLFAKGVPKDKATVEIEKDSLSISFPAGSSDYNLTLDPLYAEVDPSSSSYRITPTKVEIILKKAVPGKWKALESDRPASMPQDARTAIPDEILKSAKPKEAAPVYPSSSKTGAKDWDKLANDVEDEGDYGDAAHHFFQKLYKDADPDKQRAMMKSYMESGGTVLSTDWNEVGSRTVVPEPPEGMEAKKW